MIIRVETYSFPKEGGEELNSTRDIDYRRKADRVWLAKHLQWAFNNGRGVRTYRVAR